ncbi:restriction endonuclease (plasmid) [Curtobacterium flaccumfaciens]|uniref:Restriction endonuclease n=2 Tax=Curtobacterium poinsettiae TaxID=159612 RepID=A0A9Q9PAC0_9MICO|nr:restriction endonuclease [Curtobacterium flaccumfaciens]MCU0154570.1 restriction endonuclease [Curtobacterium flaccumfaciens pv. poinsettiae]UXN16892.1 restriction endonuclease [Curtobacterium flaccumfaciens pv. poinsettiae]UXN27159.1 restriction endonuclease [Curtobacterium flaccumfaciens]UYC82708.1 restriction endonuclease [Curtobacterium flaccumfaciens pv. poinsettiae]
MAEELAAGHMRAMGFTDARRTTAGADGGIDIIIATDAVAQVKHLAVPVGSPDVQRLRGAAHGIGHAVFYASGGYSAQAVAAADRSGVALFTFATTGEANGANAHAERLEHGADPERARALMEAGEVAMQEAKAALDGANTLANSVGNQLREAATPADLVIRWLTEFVARSRRLLDVFTRETTQWATAIERDETLADFATFAEAMQLLRESAERNLEVGRADLKRARRGAGTVEH